MSWRWTSGVKYSKTYAVHKNFVIAAVHLLVSTCPFPTIYKVQICCILCYFMLLGYSKSSKTVVERVLIVNHLLITSGLEGILVSFP